MFQCTTALPMARPVKVVAPADDDGDVLMMQPYDAAAMDCDGAQSQSTDDNEEDDEDEYEDSVEQHDSSRGTSIAKRMGMPSRGSADSLASTASSSSSSLYREPELSQSFGSTKSYDLMTPIKPYHPLPSTGMATPASMRRDASDSSVQRFPFASTPVAKALPSHVLPSSQISPRTVTDLPLRRDEASNERSTPVTPLEARRLPPPGLAGRLKINLPNANMQFDGPTTPGGHAASFARDGAASGSMPLSPFEPPTPLVAPSDSPFSGSSTGVTTPTSATRPKLLHRHSSARQTPLAMSPLAKELSSIGMRKTMSSKGSDASTASSSRSAISDSNSSTASSASTLLTPPFSPYTQSRPLPGESELSVSAPKRSASGGSTSGQASNSASSAGSNGKATRTVSPRPKSAAKGSKVAPYPSPRDEMPSASSSLDTGKPTAAFMAATQSQPATSHYFGAPPAAAGKPNGADSDVAASPPRSQPSMLQDVVKPAAAASSPSQPKSVKMTKSHSEPVPRTVSARHLANRQLHPTFARTYALGDELGSGGFGFVVGATRLTDGLPVAVKFIWKDKVPSHGWVRDDHFGAIPMEAFVLKVIDSPFVVKFVDLFVDNDFFYLIMEHHGSPWQAPQADEKPAPAPALPPSSSSKTIVGLHLSPIDTKAALTSTKAAAPTPSPTVAVFPPGSDVPVLDDNDALLSSSPTDMSDDAVSDTSTSSLSSLRPAPMERRSSCDLFECIEQHSHFSEDRARWVFAQIVEAVYDLDRRGICHRDIKDENCVVDKDFNVKLIDFGSAVITDPRKPTPYFNRFFGTMTFASSEILQGKQYRAPHAEVWSLGVLLSILLSGECPFADPQAAIRGKISKPSKSWSPGAADLLMGCLTVDPDARATIRDVREHPWVVKAWSQQGRTRPGSQPRA